MSILIGFLYVVEVLACVLLALVVMIQKPKEGGLGGLGGGSAMEAALGADAGNVLVKATAILGTVFLLNTLLLVKLTSTPEQNALDVKLQDAAAAEQQPAPDGGEAQ
ncbi:MAG: preprotein translocase subunit SecG [Kiritimatiellae bacterium]|nr:preprotein translocase subunit SecG [Kiritimatiellia bacterium]